MVKRIFAAVGRAVAGSSLIVPGDRPAVTKDFPEVAPGVVRNQP